MRSGIYGKEIEDIYSRDLNSNINPKNKNLL